MRNKLTELAACEEAVEWCGDRSPEEAYRDCERGDWLLWMAAKCGVERKLIVLAACDCAATVEHLAGAEAREAIRVTRLWCDGEATLQEVKDDAHAARAAYYAATATHAAYAATYAYIAATDAAAYTAYAASYAASYAAVASTRKEKLRELADIVRTRISFEDFENSI